MKYIYSVYDVVAEVFGPLVVYGRDEVAIRMFKDALLAPESPFAKHPADFQLVCVGTFEDDAAKLSVRPVTGCAIREIVTAATLLAADGPQLAQEA